MSILCILIYWSISTAQREKKICKITFHNILVVQSNLYLFINKYKSNQYNYFGMYSVIYRGKRPSEKKFRKAELLQNSLLQQTARQPSDTVRLCCQTVPITHRCDRSRGTQCYASCRRPTTTGTQQVPWIGTLDHGHVSVFLQRPELMPGTFWFCGCMAVWRFHNRTPGLHSPHKLWDLLPPRPPYV